MEENLIAKVAVENTTYSFDMSFDYIVPKELADEAKVGCRVLVPFGRRDSVRQGMILEVSSQPKSDKIKAITAVLDKAPLLSEEMINLAVWMKNRYFCTYFDAIKLMRPVGIDMKIVSSYCLSDKAGNCDYESLSNNEKKVLEIFNGLKKPILKEVLLELFDDDKDANALSSLIGRGIVTKTGDAIRKMGDASVKMVRINDEYLDPCNIENIKLTPKQMSVYETLCAVGEASAKEICYFTGVTCSVVDSIVKKGIAEYFENEIYRDPYKMQSNEIDNRKIVLTTEQKKAYDSLYNKYKENNGNVSLLYGITGSGKTSVFMKLIDDVIADEKCVILMVPEISLTSQMIEKFKARYADKVAVFHSALSLGERLDEWKRVKRGQARIAIGTRSAVFAPMQNIGLIIMDEEQEYTYKSEASPRFHTRDIAKFRCNYNNALLLLASATPSIESYFLAKNGRYSLNTLATRYGDVELPRVTIADMNCEIEGGNVSSFGSVLLRELRQNIDNNKQSILLLNRRGYSTFVSCSECGEVVSCPNCSISMTYHSANHRLMCHYCGYSIKFTSECPSCHQMSVKYLGVGTQKVEDELSRLIPDARILRMDTDTTMSKFSHEKKLKQFSDGEYDIMIGTQMVAKGLDFDNVTLVGVLSADRELYNNDFRGYERAFSLLTQVVGRAGRRKQSGRAIIQTLTPENEVIQLAAKQDYDAFYDNEIQIRKTMLYPPFSDICVIGFVGANDQKTSEASKEFFRQFKKLAANKYSDLPIRAMPPSTAMLNKINNKYRYKIIIKCRNTNRFREMVSGLLKSFLKERKFSKVNTFIDINPDNIM